MNVAILVVLWNLITKQFFPTETLPVSAISAPLPTTSPTSTPTNTPTVTPTPKPKPKPNPSPVTQTGSGDLLRSVNTFRTTQQLSPLLSDDYLCKVAIARTRDLAGLGKLDQHQGYQQYIGEISSHFKAWGEIIHTASSNWSAGDIVNTSWGTSNKGHREAMLNAAFNRGCGSIQGAYAVFEFGQK